MSSTNSGGTSKRRKVEGSNFASQTISRPTQSPPISQPSRNSSQHDPNSKVSSQGTGAANYIKAADRILVCCFFIYILFYSLNDTFANFFI